MNKRTGFICDESYFWHQVGSGALNISSGGYVQEDIYAENGESKRRIKNLLERSKFMNELMQIGPRYANRKEIAMNHSQEYIDKVKTLSDKGGGDAGTHAIVGPGSYEIALLAVGGVLTAIDSVMEESVTNAYALVRPPGHHAEYAEGYGFCLFNNVAIGAKYARKKYGLKRIGIFDWDVHHGNGIESAFIEDETVLYISIHMEKTPPIERGKIEHTGNGKGSGYNVNIELPAGTGNDGYLYAMEHVVEPIFNQYSPELILVAAGQDASRFDPIGRMSLTTEGYYKMASKVVALAEKNCKGRVIACHEGGYSNAYVPFCTLRIIEALTKKLSKVKDPFYRGYEVGPIYPHQKNAVKRTVEIQSLYWNLKREKSNEN